MADCACPEDAARALALGVDYVGSTLSGYLGGPEPVDPDLDLIAAMRKLTPRVIAEGRIRNPEQAAAAVEAGAMAVVVGSAISRPEHATEWFREAMRSAWAHAGSGTVLAVDIGGTKSMAALVHGGTVLDTLTQPTDRNAGPDAWIAQIAEVVTPWRGRYDRAALAVTGFVDGGNWSALNPTTLNIPDRYPLVQEAERALGVPALAVNDAQAAAWGEYRHGSGKDIADMVFLTISTGIGGGVVLNGRLLEGLGGSFGLIRGTLDAPPLEDQVTGRWIMREAARAGHPGDAVAVFEAARNGASWAAKLVDASASRVAALCRDIQMTFDPKLIVVGGGIGLAAGYLDTVRRRLDALPARQRPRLVAAALGARAGAIGAADLARRRLRTRN